MRIIVKVFYMNKSILEPVFIVILLLTYMFLWGFKRRRQIKETGIDPEVIGKAASSTQKFMNVLLKLISSYAVVILILHGAGVQFHSFFSRYAALDAAAADIAGFLLGMFGLGLCLHAQVKMGASWRVGIDEKAKTALVTDGIYRYVRNPTYLGLFGMFIGAWIIWPTWTIAILLLAFILTLEFQVRCEEEYLESIHGDAYLQYKSKSKRYIPFLY